MNGIERMRKLNKLSQSELARQIEVAQSNVSQWETGKAFPSTEKLPILAKILGCTIDDLFNLKTGENEGQPAERS